MLPSLFNNSLLQNLEKTVEFADRRHSILAGNIANMDTPGYKSRDLSQSTFQENLKSLYEARMRKEESLGATRLQSAGQLEEDGALTEDQAIENVFDAMKQVVYHDGSDDNIELQVTEMAKNQSLHSMAVALMKSQFSTLKMAISESVNV